MKTTKLKLLPLGTKAFAVAKNFVDTGHHGAGAQVVPVKLLTYRNTGGIVQQIWESKKREITSEGWYINPTLEEAVRLLKPPLHKKDWRPEDDSKKFTLKEISNAWRKLYGENLRTDYSGFYKHLANDGKEPKTKRSNRKKG